MSDITQQYESTSFGNVELDDPLVFETIQDFSGGEDSFRRSTLIDPNQCQHLLNIIVRDNYEARTRPGADAIPAAKALPIAGATSVFALRYFDTLGVSSIHQLLASVAAGNSANFLKFEGNAWTDLSALWKPASSDIRVAMAQGINTLLVSDGVGAAQIWDGTAFTSAGTAANTNFPTGATILCWHTGRMFASGVSTAPDTIYVSALLDYTTGHWNLTTRSFRIGVGDGDPIVAVASMQGFTLCVLKRNSLWLSNTDPTSDAFGGTGGFSASAVTGNIGYGIGCVGRDAWCSYGNDILFMAQDGVRSVQRMQAAAGQWQMSAPLSQPIQPIIARINQSAWDKVCAVKYQEFALFFVPLDNSTTNNAVLVWNGRLQKWMGMWQTPQLGQPGYAANNLTWNVNCVEVTRFSGTQRLVFGDQAGHVNQWKDLSAVKEDSTYNDNGNGYATQVWTRSMQFGETVGNKTAYNTVMRFSAGNAALTLSWMADLELLKTWNGTFGQTGDILGIGTLPFLLASGSPSKVSKGIRGLPAFNEAFLRIESNSGWFWLRNIVAGAFINPLKETL
jgi:hypothetical protein